MALGSGAARIIPLATLRASLERSEAAPLDWWDTEGEEAERRTRVAWLRLSSAELSRFSELRELEAERLGALL